MQDVGTFQSLRVNDETHNAKKEKGGTCNAGKIRESYVSLGKPLAHRLDDMRLQAKVASYGIVWRPIVLSIRRIINHRRGFTMLRICRR